MKKLIIVFLLLSFSFTTNRIVFTGSNAVKISKMIRIYPIMKSNYEMLKEDVQSMYWFNSNCEQALIQVDRQRETSDFFVKAIGAVAIVELVIIIIQAVVNAQIQQNQ